MVSQLCQTSLGRKLHSCHVFVVNCYCVHGCTGNKFGIICPTKWKVFPTSYFPFSDYFLPHVSLNCISQESPQPQNIEQNNAAMELINSVTGVDEEGRSRQRVLTFAAKRCVFFFLYILLYWMVTTSLKNTLIVMFLRIRRYASAIERNPDDHDALYNWALVLQVWVHFPFSISAQVQTPVAFVLAFC